MMRPSTCWSRRMASIAAWPSDRNKHRKWLCCCCRRRSALYSMLTNYNLRLERLLLDGVVSLCLCSVLVALLSTVSGLLFVAVSHVLLHV